MQGLVKDYLGGTISRRSFIRRSTAAGFSVVAARSAIDALQPIVNANQASTFSTQQLPQPLSPDWWRTPRRTAACGGVRFMFVCNSLVWVRLLRRNS